MMFAFFTKPNFIVERAKPLDAGSIAILHGKNFAHGWLQDDILGMIESKAHLTNVVRPSKGGAVQGFLIVRVTLDEAEILTIALDKSIQNRGLASKMLEQTFPLLVQRGVKTLFLEVADDNFAALKLYKNFGFERIATRKNYYVEKGRMKDALVMQRKL